MSKIAVVIPARMASTRFPAKPLHNIAGKPLLAWVIEAVKASSLVNQVVVATDHQQIYDLAQAYSATAVMTDSGLQSGTDRVHAAIEQLGLDCDIVVNVQGDEPLVNASLIESLVQPLLQDSGLEMATLAHPLDTAELTNPNSVKVLVNQYSQAIYFSRLPIPYSRSGLDGAASSCVFKHIGLYAYRRQFLTKFCKTPPADIEKAEALEQLRALYLGARIAVRITEQKLIGVDTPEDAQRVEKLLLGG